MGSLRSSLVLLALIAVAACPKPPPAPDPGCIYVANMSRGDIDGIYHTAESSDAWGANDLFAPLADAQHHWILNIGRGPWKVAVEAGGQRLEVHDLAIPDGHTLVIYVVDPAIFDRPGPLELTTEAYDNDTFAALFL